MGIFAIEKILPSTTTYLSSSSMLQLSLERLGDYHNGMSFNALRGIHSHIFILNGVIHLKTNALGDFRSLKLDHIFLKWTDDSYMPILLVYIINGSTETQSSPCYPLSVSLLLCRKRQISSAQRTPEFSYKCLISVQQ